jgi:hypothetical protein
MKGGFIKYFLRELFIRIGTRPSLRNSLFERVNSLNAQKIIDAYTHPDNRNLYTLAAGPFLGVTFIKEDFWSSNHETALKIMGCYEYQILRELEKYSIENFVSLGAAGGYYAISLLKTKCKNAILIESDKRNYPLIYENARLNLVEEKVTIVEDINCIFTELAPTISKGSNNLLICDIEGDEYDLLSDNALISRLHSHNFILIIELHDRNSHLRNSLKEKLSSYYKVRSLPSTERNIASHNLIPNIYESAMILAENRGNNYEFILCD